LAVINNGIIVSPCLVDCFFHLFHNSQHF
jgi:predicted amidohydrolase